MANASRTDCRADFGAAGNFGSFGVFDLAAFSSLAVLGSLGSFGAVEMNGYGLAGSAR
jgi:hypothetical protein